MRLLAFCSAVGVMMYVSDGALAQVTPDQNEGEVRAIVTPSGEIRYFRVKSREGRQMTTGDVELMGIDRTIEWLSKRNGYELRDRDGEFKGILLGVEEEQLPERIEAAVPGLEAKPLADMPIHDWASYSRAADLYGMYELMPLPDDQFLSQLSTSMADQARKLGCGGQFRPKEISVAASLGASVGAFLVEGDGSISFSAVWETAEICR